MRTFEGRVAVVTGAASGIGLATCELLARRGMRIALADIDRAQLVAAAERVREAGAASLSTHVVDVASAEAVERMRDEVVAEHGAAHLLINNAGVGVMADFADQSLEDWEWIVGVNFWGVVHGCRSFLPVLLGQEEAHIVNVSSMFGFIGLPGQSAYCATKFAVRGFSEALWADLSQTSVGVTSVHPGGIRTNIVRATRTQDEEAREQAQASFDRWAHPPGQVASAIVRAVSRKKLRVIVGAEAFLTEWLKRLAPVAIHRLIALRMRFAR